MEGCNWMMKVEDGLFVVFLFLFVVLKAEDGATTNRRKAWWVGGAFLVGMD